MENIVLESKIFTNNPRRQLFVFLSVTAILFCLAYVSLVNKVVFNIVERENLEEKIAILDSKIGELEFEYISLSGKIDLNLAYSLGFSNASDVKFVSRDFSVGRSLSLRTRVD